MKRAELLFRLEAIGLALLMLLQLAGCGAAPEEGDPVDPHEAKWRKLDDGSVFTTVSDLQNGFAVAMRCWPNAKSGFRCIQVFDNTSTSFPVRDIVRIDEDKLPEWVIPMQPNLSGYSCGTVLGSSEKIVRNGATLITNRLDTLEGVWSRSYVDQYLAENDVKGQRWFPCLRVLRAVINGSLETLSTTSITKKDLGEN